MRTYVHEQIDGANDPSLGILQRGGKGRERNPRAIRPLEDGLLSAHRPAFPKRYRHRALVMSHGPPVGPVKAPRAAPSILANSRRNAPKLGGGTIEVGDPPLG